MHALVALAYALPMCRPLVFVHFFRVAFLCVRPLGLRVVVIMICRGCLHKKQTILSGKGPSFFKKTRSAHGPVRLGEASGLKSQVSFTRYYHISKM